MRQLGGEDRVMKGRGGRLSPEAAPHWEGGASHQEEPMVTMVRHESQQAVHTTACRCGQELDLCHGAHCPRCGSSLTASSTESSSSTGTAGDHQ